MYTVNDNSLQSIADSIRKKAKKTEKLSFPAGFVSAIDGIETGGGSAPVVVEEPEEKDVNFYDYDGRRLFSYTSEEAAALTELPTPPGHEGLVFQEWNYTLDEVKEHAEAADIGALYTTDDGATRAEIELSAYLDVLLRFTQTKASGVLIDWGDGNSERSGVSASYLHNYESPGAYVITLTVDDDCTITLGANGSYFINISSLNISASQNVLRNLYIGDRVTKIGTAAFARHYELRTISMNNRVLVLEKECFRESAISFITIPPGVYTIPDSSFTNCRQMRHISIPIAVNVLGKYFLSTALVLKRISITENVTLISNGFCSQCKGLERAVFYGKIESFQGSLLDDSYSLKTVDLTHCEAIPTLQSTLNFSGAPSSLEILVPAALAEEWKQATNWTKYANNIKGV